MEAKKRNCWLFVFDGYSDWEPSIAVAGLNVFTDFAVKTFSVTGQPVRSMGNLQVVPDKALKDVHIGDIDLLILPGGNSWDEGKNKEIIPLVNDVLDRQKLLAAICGATGFLAQHHYLDHIRHTSNHLEFYLKKIAPDYKGDELYVKEHAVLEGNLLTANGTAMVEFAAEIFRYFDLLKIEPLNFWFHFFQERDAELKK
jgi:putative intracellular protease/amidase